ncbi:facilitated trehalose transporter Tret1-like [Epargyreus clarus]|uniref:facilitated trehalose transporter Tret1-like n=1 Tax=Epargyreus clarus TaxID=520877 RepID=UPI003C2BEE3C
MDSPSQTVSDHNQVEIEDSGIYKAIFTKDGTLPENEAIEHSPRGSVQGWWRTPFMKQCFATSGVTLSAMGDALVMCFTSVLLPQLRQSEDIKLDAEQESWIASIVGLALIIGIIIVPSIMGRYGRRTANAISNGLLAVSWFALFLASDYHSILFIRLLQGLSIGMTSILAPIIIGEYTSPKYRGAFLSTIALAISLGILFVHSFSVFFTWKQLCLIFTATTLLDCVIVVCSPETPTFLAARGRYEECRKVFRSLRYPEEEIELEKMIKANMNKTVINTNGTSFRDRFKGKLNYFLEMAKKREFYKPVILMFHLHIINEWSGSNIIEAYTRDIYAVIIGKNVDISLVMISTDICNLISNFLAIIIIRKVRRRVMLLGTISLNLLSFLLTAAHVYAKSCGISTFDYPIVGIVLVHFHMFTLAIGNLPLPNIISGEIFCLEYRGISSMITLLFFCVNMIISMKTALFLFANIGLHGTYLLYAGFVSYGLLVSMIMLPETKDKTLLDIEEEFRGVKEDFETFIPHPDIELRKR